MSRLFLFDNNPLEPENRPAGDFHFKLFFVLAPFDFSNNFFLELLGLAIDFSEHKLDFNFQKPPGDIFFENS